MGMTIDDCIDELQKLKLPISKHDLSFHFVEHTRNKTVETAIETIRKYQMFQADYKARLKADLVAMLEELKEQLREMHEDFFETEHFDEAYGVSNSIDIIQQKIDKLKEA